MSYSTKYYAANLEKCRASQKAYRERNRATLVAKKKAAYAAKKDVASARSKAYRAANLDAIKAQKKAYYEANRQARIAAMKVWNKENAHIKAECEARRRQVIRTKMPWKDVGLVRDIYRLARIYRDAGINCAVDHIVPLRNKIVTGLHVQQNLTVLLRDANSSKGNRWWPDMPEAIVASV